MADAGIKQKGELKTARIPIKIVPQEPLKKPDWIRVKAGNDAGRFGEIKKMLREQKLHTVCEEAACPNIGECFGRGTATFMILGDICTRRCPFCDVGHGKPLPPDVDEPRHLAESVANLKLRYVVITSVDRDDLRAWTSSINTYALVPDVTVVLDVDFDRCADRIHARAAKDIYDAERFQRLVHAFYAQAAGLLPREAVVHVDANGPESVVTASILATLDSRVNDPARRHDSLVAAAVVEALASVAA